MTPAEVFRGRKDWKYCPLGRGLWSAPPPARVEVLVGVPASSLAVWGQTRVAGSALGI